MDDVDKRTLTCGYWNINGHRSKYLGDKLLDEEFLNMIKECDVIGLGEIQSKEKVDIPGFKCVDQKIRDMKKNCVGPKIAGGLGVYVRNEVNSFVELVPNSCDDSIWIRLKEDNIYIGTYYVSPKYSKSRDIDFFSTLNEEITYFEKMGTIFLQGDLNARTGTDLDFIRAGKYDLCDEEVDESYSDTLDPNLRNSEDSIVNARGKELLDLCKLNKLVIINGRKNGDLFGKNTCHNWNGSSVVDYLLAPASCIDFISSFVVGCYVPWLSDHCIITTKILLRGNYTEDIASEELKDAHPGFFWNETSLASYNNELQCDLAQQKVNQMLAAPSLDSIELATNICGFLLATVSSAGVKQKRPFNEESGKKQPWFDYECKSEKEKLCILSKKLKKNPNDKNTRDQVLDAKKNFKRIILAKKRRLRTVLVDKLTTTKHDKNLKEHWKTFRKLSPKNTADPRQPSMSEFQNYFEKLSQSKRAQNIPSPSGSDGPLDYLISTEELNKACDRLKQGKAHGQDVLCNEMIIPLVEHYPKLALKLFNQILQTCDVIPEWITGLIVPIHKDGSKMDPGNYRGITLMSCLGKLFLSILNNRLMTYVVENNILSNNQLGFVPGNRTSDAHIIINNLINKTCHKNGKKVFSCFVDFRKAFDLVPRDILLSKLLKYGINGKFFNIIRHIYTKDKACVKLKGKCSNCFDINIGVRQGCILSPLLFNIFLCDLAKSLTEIEFPALGNINSLFWADDLVMFADSEMGLQKLLSILEGYCAENELTVNTKKTKCMIFNSSGRLLLRPFFLNNVQLECVRSYKYLGFIITPSGECLTGLKDLKDRGFKAFMKIKSDLGASFNHDISLILSLVQSLVKPILLYASDFWGCYKLPKNNPIETFYMSILKQILGVQKQTTNDGVLLELGLTPICFDAKKFAVKNWERIIRGDANMLLISSHRESVYLDLPWTSLIRSDLEKIGLLNFYTDDHSSKPPFVFKRMFERLCDIFHQETFEKINGNRSKLRTYAIFKKEKGYEKYLTDTKNVTTRKNVTKFRLSNHKLLIEVGRHQGLEANERFCPFCTHSVEDEMHFIFECSIYKDQRNRFLVPITSQIHNFSFLPRDQKFELVMCSMDENVCNFISNSMEIREFLMSKPRVNA